MGKIGLKPCPFCGGKATVLINICKEINFTGYRVFHNGFNCPMGNLETPLKDTEIEAVKSWNNRVQN